MLDHFVAAQDRVYEQVLAELRAGHKQTHWMWFIFPQLRALGKSPMAQKFGLADLHAARAYAFHPILGPRLVECTGLVNRVPGRTAHDIFGSPDDLKFGSSMTLFAHADHEEPAFRDALEKYYGGTEDPLTLGLL
ncbi:MAG: DUF1810 domain-containing protein [Devosia sp.]